MRVLVTGAAGQVGSHTVDKLVERGDHVLGIDNFATGRPEHVRSQAENYQFVHGSISDQTLIRRCFEDFGPEVVVHTAASYKDPDDWAGDISTNICGMANLIEGSKSSGTRRIVYFQTALIYGVKPQTNPVPLDHPRRIDNSSYAISKGVAEDYLNLSTLDHVTFRLANVIGPRNVSGPLPIFYQRLTIGKQCFVTPARRDFVFVGDLVRTVIMAVDGRGKGAYHFSSGADVAVKDLYVAVASSLGMTTVPEPELRPLSVDDAPSILLDPARTFRDFGMIEFTSLEETVEEAVRYYRTYGVAGEYTHLKFTGP